MKRIAFYIAALLIALVAVPVYAQDFEENAITIFGVNEAIATTSVPVADSTEIVLMPAAATVEVSSTSTDDGPAGTGVLTLRIEGLNSNWDAVTEDITLDGTTAAVSANTYARINRIVGLTFGTLAAASGEITLSDGSSNRLARIVAGQTASHNGFYSVPRYKNAYINFVGASAVTQPVKFRLMIREYGGAFNLVDAFNLSGGETVRDLRYKAIAPPKSDIVLYGAATSSTAAVTGTIQIKLKN